MAWTNACRSRTSFVARASRSMHCRLRKVRSPLLDRREVGRAVQDRADLGGPVRLAVEPLDRVMEERAAGRRVVAARLPDARHRPRPEVLAAGLLGVEVQDAGATGRDADLRDAERDRRHILQVLHWRKRSFSFGVAWMSLSMCIWLAICLTCAKASSKGNLHDRRRLDVSLGSLPCADIPSRQESWAMTYCRTSCLVQDRFGGLSGRP